MLAGLQNLAGNRLGLQKPSLAFYLLGCVSFRLAACRFHVNDQTKADYETSLRICRALDTTPNAILDTEPPQAEQEEAEVLRARITAAVVDVLAKEHEPKGARRPIRREAWPGPKGTPT